MIAHKRPSAGKLIENDFVRFCLVGATGFIINFALLALFYKQIKLPIFLAQAISSEIALGSNFVLHHNWTYKGHKVKKTIPQLLLQFHAASWVAILGSSAIVSLGVHNFKLHYGVALVIASLIALGWNYCWTKFAIWRRQRPHAPKPTANSISSKSETGPLV